MSILVEGLILPDATVRGVARLMEPDGPKRFLKDLAAALEIERPTRIRVVRQRLGQRMVLRVDGVGHLGEESFYAKLIRSASAASEEKLTWQTAMAEAAAFQGVTVPRPLAYLPRFRAVIYRAIPSRPWLPCSPVAAAAQEPSGRAVLDPRDLGRAIARLHETLPHPAATEGIAEEWRRLERAEEKLAKHRVDLLPLFRERLRSIAGRPPADSRSEERVTIHGDLHPMQILVPVPNGTTSLGILDWDGSVVGDCERDLGNLIAHLQMEGEMGHLSEEAVPRWESQLLSGYSEIRAVEWARLEHYRRATILRIAALHADPSFGHSPPNPSTLPARMLDRL